MNIAARRLSSHPTCREEAVAASHRFDELYQRYFGFVWRNMRRLGVPEHLVEDALQDTFMVVHRRRDDLRVDASARAWIFGIAVRVARDYRRTRRRKPSESADVDAHASAAPSPFESTATTEARQLLESFLSTLDEAKRTIFVMAELEDMTAQEMSSVVGAGPNTVYSRLRSARALFVEFVDAQRGDHE